MSEFRSIFISGPSEVAPIATAVKARLEASGHRVMLMPFDPQPLDPARLSTKELAKCQAVILLLNTKYGTPRPELNNCSITELEFDETLRRRLPLFCFIGQDLAAREPRLAELVAKVERAASERRLDFTYTKTNLADKDSAVNEVCRSVERFRWTPLEFSSFGEWEVFLAHLHSRISKVAPDPDKLPSPIGRAKPRQALIDALLSKGKGGAVLSGLPAHGKTISVYHAIREMIDTVKAGYPDVHVILSGQAVHIESVRQLTPDPGSDRPLVIVIDDADEREDLPNLVKMLANSPHFPRMRLILICQEGEEGQIYRRSHPFVAPELFPPITLAKLSFDELKDYVRTNNLALTEPNVLAIRRITNGVPLYVDLYFHHGYDPRTIGNAVDMQSHFRDYILGEVRDKGKEPQLAAAKALALTGGASPDDPTLKAVFASLTQPGDFRALLEDLRAKRLVYLVGRKYKLHNRIVQDFILTEYWAKKPDSDLLLTLILTIKESAKPVLENIARAEWVIQKSSATPQPSPFADVWAAIEVSFGKSTDIEERTELLKLLGDAAYYLPDLGLGLLRQTYKRYAANLKGLSDSQKDEIEAASQIAYALAQIAKDDKALFEECIDYLWDFGKHDTRALNACPSHAHRHLESLAEFRPGPRMAQYRTILAHIQKWLEQGVKESTEWDHAPLEILKEFLEKEWEQTYAQGHVFTIKRGELEHTAELEEFKLTVIALLPRCIRGEFGARLIPEATHLLRGQLPIYQPPKWAKLGETALKELESLATEAISQGRAEAAYVLIHVMDDLLDVFKDKEERGIPAIREVRVRLHKSLAEAHPERHALLDGLLGRRFTGPEEEKIRMAQEALMAAGVPRAAEILEEIHNQLVRVGIQPHTTALAYRSGDDAAWTDFSAKLARQILDKTANRGLLWGGVQYIWSCRIAADKSDAHRKDYLAFLEAFNQKVLDPKTPEGIRRDLDDAIRRLIWFLLKDHPEVKLLPEERALISRWKVSPDHTWGFIVAKLAEADITSAKSLLLAASIDSNARHASEVCSTLVNSAPLLAAFGQADWESLLNALVSVPEIEDYWIEQALIRASNQQPLVAAALFERRIRHYVSLGDEHGDYRPLPYLIESQFQGAFRALTSELKAQLINKAIDFVRDSGLGGIESLFYAEYANLIAGQFTAEAAAVLRARAKNADPRELKAVAYSVQHSYPNFVLDHADIVDALLTSAQKISEDVLRSVGSCLAAGAHSRSISRAIGEPAREYVEMRERAAQLKRQHLPDSITYKFYSNLEKAAQWDLEREAADDAEVMDE